MYGSVVQVAIDDGNSIPMDIPDLSFNHEYPFGESPESFDDSFWKEVKDENVKNGLSRVKALRTVRLRRLKQNCKKDLLVELITKRHDAYYRWCKTFGGMDLYPTFKFELSELVSILLDDDFASDSPLYVNILKLDDGSRKNILHLAAERNLVQIAKKVLDFEKNVAVATSSPGDMYPLHFALQERHDEASSLLVRAMDNGRVRELFEGNEIEGPRFRFGALISDGNMKKTVEAVLDCLMNPDWPFIPVNKDDDDKGLLIPNMPFRYHFYYRILDGDEDGQPGKMDGIMNSEFNSKSKSCLQLLAENSTGEDATIRHPVVRMLMRSKWNAFGRKWVRAQFLLYILFLTLMSISFLVEPSTGDHRRYSHPIDYLRIVCEIGTLLFTLYYVVSEIDQLVKEKLSYFYDPFNYFDVLGLVLILVVIPLRFTKNSSAEFAVSAAAYLINFLRISKCSCAFKSMSIYAKTFGNIICQEISRFALLFFVFMLSFTGTVFLVFKATKEQNSGIGYWFVFLQEVRAIAEANGFAETDQYVGMHVGLVILIMANMFFVIVVLNNILIGQIGNSFNDAQVNAKIKYDIDRTKFVTRIESSTFCSWSLRAAHYVDKEFLNNELLEDDLLEDWAMLKKGHAEKEKRKTAIKLMMQNKLKLSTAADGFSKEE